MADHPEEFASWLAGAERALAGLADLDLLLEEGAASLDAQARQLFSQLESDGHDRATVEQALAREAASAPATFSNPGDRVTTRGRRAGRMV